MTFKGKSTKAVESSEATAGLRIELTQALREVLERVKTTDTDRRKVEAALIAARQELSRIEGERATASARLAATESESALTGGASDTSARRAIVNLRDAVEFAQAKVSGLEGRLQIASDAVGQARRDLATAWADWQRDLAAAFLVEYSIALQRFVGVLNQARALGFGLEAPVNKPLIAFGFNTFVFEPNSQINLADGRRNSWRADEAARALNEAVNTIRGTVQPYLGGSQADEPGIEAKSSGAESMIQIERTQ